MVGVCHPGYWSVMHHCGLNVVPVYVYFVLYLSRLEDVVLDCSFLLVVYTDLVGLLSIDGDHLDGVMPDLEYLYFVHVVAVVRDYSEPYANVLSCGTKKRFPENVTCEVLNHPLLWAEN